MEKNIKILEDRYNKLLRRREVKLLIIHHFKGTPKREEVRKIISKIFSSPLERIIVKQILTQYGLAESLVEAHIYDDVETLRKVESEYILIRNFPELKQEKKEEGG
ncbi:MAG TPA: 30S ribosomal protein S24e [Thermoproteales archaeon]|nr:30S ribosomal protein S24e [Thermoproteales archaeon]